MNIQVLQKFSTNQNQQTKNQINLTHTHPPVKKLDQEKNKMFFWEKKWVEEKKGWVSL